MIEQDKAAAPAAKSPQDPSKGAGVRFPPPLVFLL